MGNDGQGNGYCNDENVCKCYTDYHDGASQCNIDMSCTIYNQARCGDHGVCIIAGQSDDGVCQCNPGWFSLNTNCDTFSYPCVDNIQCGAGTCDSGQCNCRS